ncbi:hypothetical protein D9M71_789090 [compost metagenome]
MHGARGLIETDLAGVGRSCSQVCRVELHTFGGRQGQAQVVIADLPLHLVGQQLVERFALEGVIQHLVEVAFVHQSAGGQLGGQGSSTYGQQGAAQRRVFEEFHWSAAPGQNWRVKRSTNWSWLSR